VTIKTVRPFSYILNKLGVHHLSSVWESGLALTDRYLLFLQKKEKWLSLV